MLIIIILFLFRHQVHLEVFLTHPNYLLQPIWLAAAMYLDHEIYNWLPASANNSLSFSTSVSANFAKVSIPPAIRISDIFGPIPSTLVKSSTSFSSTSVNSASTTSSLSTFLADCFFYLFNWFSCSFLCFLWLFSLNNHYSQRVQ